VGLTSPQGVKSTNSCGVCSVSSFKNSIGGARAAALPPSNAMVVAAENELLHVQVSSRLREISLLC
jgi:hypothetical protein